MTGFVVAVRQHKKRFGYLLGSDDILTPSPKNGLPQQFNNISYKYKQLQKASLSAVSSVRTIVVACSVAAKHTNVVNLQ